MQAFGDGGREEKDNKELMHVLESTLITWTKQIKSVLKQVSNTCFCNSTCISPRFCATEFCLTCMKVEAEFLSKELCMSDEK